MTLIAYGLLAVNLSILLTVQEVESQHVPKTCKCPQAKIKVRGLFSNFTFTPKGPNCLEDEIIWVYMFCYSPYFSLESYGIRTITLCVSIRKVTKAKDFWNVGKDGGREPKRLPEENTVQSLCKVLWCHCTLICTKQAKDIRKG
uniref:Chemokine ligand-like protein n=2 Tax=Ctenopharyngodon idella TaxID=7959 RepID=A0A345D759_CTEID|nr:chemokine ligand-like protein [Ctenopharyngodon idella]